MFGSQVVKIKSFALNHEHDKRHDLMQNTLS